MQTVIVIVIVAAAAFYLARRFYNSVRKKEDASSCGCGCTGCSPNIKQEACDEKADRCSSSGQAP